MKQFSKLALVIGGMCSCIGLLYAAIPDSDNNTKTFLGPTLRLGFTDTLTNNTAFSIAGEAGLKDLRVGGTLGWLWTDNRRLKFSAEYLRQKINYSFFSGDTQQWVSQGAIGAAYQYDFDVAFNPQFDLKAYYSYAPNKNLDTETITIFNPDGTQASFFLDRRIAGSHAAGIAPGFTIMPWQGGKVSALVNYDSVDYDRELTDRHNPHGFGGTLGFNQIITNGISFGLGAEIRQPFNNYAANLMWSSIPDNGSWVVGLFGNYLEGKSTLPSTWNVGLSANYLLDNRISPILANHYKDLKSEVPAPIIHDNLLSWTADPAVYMPQVLAVPEQKITGIAGCSPADAPLLISPIPDATGNRGVYDPTTIIPRSFNNPTHFSGAGITYSMSVRQPADPGCADGASPPVDQMFSINPATGEVTITVFDNGNDCTWGVTVNAVNACGSATDTFDVEVDVNA